MRMRNEIRKEVAKRKEDEVRCKTMEKVEVKIESLLGIRSKRSVLSVSDMLPDPPSSSSSSSSMSSSVIRQFFNSVSSGK